MMGKAFINEVLSSAIESYLKFRNKPEEPNFYTFPVQVIKTLIYIYGELDIINPYITHNEHNMGGFDHNLMKFGYSLENVNEFKNLFITFQKEVNDNKCPNLSFMNIEKCLIDMFLLKKKTMNLSKESEEEFKTFLYFESSESIYMKQDLVKYCVDTKELELYFCSVLFENSHNFILEEIRRSTLIPESYQLLGYSLEQINQLNDLDLQKVNEQVYTFFKVDSNDSERDELLARAVNYYKKYGNRITSGNGYVDLLLLASILSTGIFITILFAFHYL